MPSVEDIIAQMRRSPANIRFANLKKVCDSLFGQSRNNGTSHYVYSTGFADSPSLSIQEDRNGKAKPYQVKQVLRAIDRLESNHV